MLVSRADTTGEGLAARRGGTREFLRYEDPQCRFCAGRTSMTLS